MIGLHNGTSCTARICPDAGYERETARDLIHSALIVYGKRFAVLKLNNHLYNVCINGRRHRGKSKNAFTKI